MAQLNSGCLLKALPTYQRAGIAALDPSETNPTITQKGYDVIFRVCATDTVQGQRIVAHVAEHGLRSAAILHDSTDYGIGLAEVVRPAAKEAGITVTDYIATTTDEQNFITFLNNVKQHNPDAIFYSGVASGCGTLIKQARDLGMEQQFYSPDGTFGKQYIDIAGRAAEGAIVSMIGPSMSALRQAAGGYFEAFKKRFGVEVENFGPYAYDCTNILLEAMKRALDTHGRIVIEGAASTLVANPQVRHAYLGG